MLHLEIKYCLIILYCLLVLNSIDSQCTIKISGKIIDTHHDESLQFATVFIEEINRGATCGENGNFQLDSLCSGGYHFIISHFGCQTKRSYIEINKDTSIVFTLEHHSEMLDEVVVTEGFANKEGVGLNQYVISGNALQSLASKNLAQIVHYIPGVSILKSSGNIQKPIINGMMNNRIQILNQGIPQEGQQWGNDHAPEIDPFTSQKINIIKGSAAVRYGVNAIGGLIHLESLPIGNDPHIHGQGLIQYETNGNSFITNLSVQQNTSLLKYRIIATSRNTGDNHSPRYYLTNTGSNEKNGSILITNHNMKWNRSIYISTYNTKLGILRGSHIGNLSDLNDAIKRKEPLFTNQNFSYRINNPFQRVNHNLIKVSNKLFSDSTSHWNIDIAWQKNKRSEFDVRRGENANKPSLNLDLQSIWTDLYFQKENAKFTNSFGFQIKNIWNKNIAGTGINPLLPNYTLNNNSFYGIIKFPFSISSIDFGARYEFQILKVKEILIGQVKNFEYRQQNFALNVGHHLSLNHKLDVKTNISYALRSPQIHELHSYGLHQGLASIEEGNKDLENEKSFKINLDTRYEMNEKIRLSFSPFYHSINSYIYIAPSGENRLTIRGAFPVFKYKQTDALLYGFDLLYHHQFHPHLELTLKYSYLEGINRSLNTFLIYMPPVNTKCQVSYIIENLLRLDEIKFNTELSYIARQNKVPIFEDILESPPSYYLINLGISGNKIISGKQINFQVSIDNLLNTSYRDYLNRLRYFSDETGRNLTLKLQYTF